jgi:FkbM family methyltransferase
MIETTLAPTSESKTVTLLGRRLTLSGDPAEAYFRCFADGADITDNTHRCAARLLSRPDLVCVDVGANIGVFTMALASLCPTGQVYAFEPCAEAHPHFAANMARNGFGSVALLPTALGDHDGEIGFHAMTFFTAGSFASADGASWSREALGSELRRVPCERLDSFAARAGLTELHFVKIDVEGNELAVLHGARATLERFHPLVLLEFNSFALSAFQDLTAGRFLRALRDIFPLLYRLDRSDGRLHPLATEKDLYTLLHDNLTQGCVDNLLGAWDNRLLEQALSRQ